MPEAHSSEALIYRLDDETYYSDLEELFDHWKHNELPMVVNCAPLYAPNLDIDNFLCDSLADDYDAPDELVKAAITFNPTPGQEGK